MIIKNKNKNIILSIILFFSIITAASIYYKNNISNTYNTLKLIPVLHEGRIKPLDSLARIYLKAFSGAETINNKPAHIWLVDLIFKPSKDYHNKIFYIPNKNIIETLNLPNQQSHYYSFKQIIPGIKQNINLISKIEAKSRNDQQEKQKLSSDESELLGLYNNLLAYFDLSRSFSLFIPQFDKKILKQQFDINIKNNYKHKYLSYYQLLPYKHLIANKADYTLSHQINNTDILNIAKLFKDSYSDKINISLKIIPEEDYSNTQKNWLAPWEVLNSNQGSITYAKYLNLWQDVINIYYNSNTNLDIESKLLDFTLSQINDTTYNKLVLEEFYNNYKLLNKTLILYFFTFISCLALLYNSNKTTIKFTKLNILLYYTSTAVFTLAISFHLIAIICRIYILSRPPVANLYESILFVSLIVAIISIIINIFTKNKYTIKNLGLLIGSIICTSLMFIANSYSQSSDNFGVLIAVLNSNFWLGTHVVTITAGYGSCLILSGLAHIELLAFSFNNKLSNKLSLNKYILIFCLLSLFLTILGTILGGIWADQSWGRFWGWDPKENGALLICLWLIALLHGKISGQLNYLAYCALCAYTSIIVAIAWFGVNLLNTGLHSYGFTDSIAINLILFIILELVLISGLWLFNHKQRNKFKKSYAK